MGLEAELDAQAAILSALQSNLSEREEALSVRSSSTKSSRKGWITRKKSHKKMSVVSMPTPLPFSDIGVRNTSIDSVVSGMSGSVDQSNDQGQRPTLGQKKKSKRSNRLIGNTGNSVKRFFS